MRWSWIGKRWSWVDQVAGKRWSWVDKVVVVTGASAGIGRSLALDLARRRAVVVGVARRADRLDEVVGQCRQWSPASHAEVVDLAVDGAPEAMIARAEERFGRVDVLVNNAGASRRVHAVRLTAADVDAAMGINFTAPVRAALAVLPGMRARRSGRIVNVSSVAGRVGSPRESAYSASKFALVGWTESVAADLMGTGVRLHLVHPGAIRTDIWESLVEPPSYRGRFQSPESVSDAIRSCVERGYFERYAPRWMGFVPIVRAVFPRFYVAAGGRFDRRADSGGAAVSPGRTSAGGPTPPTTPTPGT